MKQREAEERKARRDEPRGYRDPQRRRRRPVAAAVAAAKRGNPSCQA
ncbi:MAG: hypothetical protein WKG07_24395 [Hymenobacter sp.]